MVVHRLQISLEKGQYDWLQERACRLGVGIAAVIRQIVRREAKQAEAGDAGILPCSLRNRHFRGRITSSCSTSCLPRR